METRPNLHDDEDVATIEFAAYVFCWFALAATLLVLVVLS